MTNNSTTHAPVSQCSDCYDPYGHDYAHPHVVAAVNAAIVASYVRPAYLDR